MTEFKRYSLEDSAPQVPLHEQTNQSLDISPTPSKSIHRSKTVRNINSAGNKMKNLFKSKNNTKENNKQITTDENGFITRPILSSSASYGPGNDHNYTTRGKKIWLFPYLNIFPYFFLYFFLIILFFHFHQRITCILKRTLMTVMLQSQSNNNNHYNHYNHLSL